VEVETQGSSVLSRIGVKYVYGTYQTRAKGWSREIKGGRISGRKREEVASRKESSSFRS